MLLSQALRTVKKLKGKMAELSARAAGVASYDQAKKPEFDFAETRSELDGVRSRLVALEAAIAVANATTTIEFEGKHLTLAAGVRWLQELKSEMAWVRQLHLRSGIEVGRDTEYNSLGQYVQVRTETTWVSAMTERDRVKQLDELQERFDTLNAAVEAANHRVTVEVPAA